MSSKGVLPITFGAVTEKNVEQLKVLNRAIFPINYNERVYKDILAFTDVTQLAYHNDVLVGAIACRLPALQINNEEAIKFYSRFGFKVAETIQGYYKRLDPPDAVLLRKQLQGGSGGGGDGGGAGSANGASA